MNASIIFKKFILNPIKKSVKWYLKQTGNSVNYVSVTGTFPPAYYEMIMEDRKKKDATSENNEKEDLKK